MKKVLVTGASGFVGANIVRRLMKDGYDVHIISRTTSNFWRLSDILSEIKDYKVDLKDKKKLEIIVKKINPDYIIHLAIYGGRPNQADETDILESNLLGTINLVNACKNVNYSAFINTGSSSEYGFKSKEIFETDYCNPTSMYGVTKSAATMYCNYRALIENKNIGTIRLFSPFGEYEERGRLIPDLIINSLVKKKVKLADPEAVRDFIYIEDVCDIYMKILEEPDHIKGEIFNVGYGQQHSVKFMAEQVKKLVSEDVVLEFNSVPGRKSDTKTWVSNINKIMGKYQWQPKYSMEEGIKKSLMWYKENLKLYKEEAK